MPAQVAKSTFNLTKSLKNHSGDALEPKRTMAEIPGGVTGIAKIVSMKIDVYKTGPNAGKKYFQARGVSVSPKTAIETKSIWDPKLNGGKGGVRTISTEEVPIDGLPTMIMIPLCDGNKYMGNELSADEQVARMVQELKHLAGEECMEGVEDEESLPELFTSIIEAEPAVYFRYKTSTRPPTAKNPQSGTWDHEWLGRKGLEDYVPDDSGAMQDNEAAHTNGKVTEPAEPEEEVSAEEETPADEAQTETAELPGEHELDELMEGVNNQDEDAQKKLKEYFLAVGGTEKEFKAATWDEVRAKIEEARGSDDAGEAAEPEETVPEKGGLCMYQQVGKDGRPLKDAKGKATKPIQCEITVVNPTKKTVDLKSSDDPKKGFKGVAWDALKSVEES